MADPVPPAPGARLAAGLGLLAVAALSWLWLWLEAARMAAAPAMPMAPAFSPAGLTATFVMWAIMMAAMMLPSVMPATTLYAAMARGRPGALPAAWTFAAGYILVWTGFSLAAAVLQAGLAEAGLLTPMMASASAPLSAALLIAAGLWQFAPLKRRCLERCRDPLSLFLMHWRAGPLGALRMGARHGLHCLGCCWALMLLLFTLGVMNLLWIAALAAWALAERLLPAGDLLGRIAGAGLIAAGAALPALA
jgi:predicted metal-binding membrane protein